jgi:hypothetical protein
MGLRVEDLGFRVWRLSVLRVRVWGLGFRTCSLRDVFSSCRYLMFIASLLQKQDKTRRTKERHESKGVKVLELKPLKTMCRKRAAASS